MARMIFVNLPVADVAASTAFYEAIGMTKDPRFSNAVASAMVWSDTISFMLLAHDFYATFTTKRIADAQTTSEVLLCLSRDSREAAEESSDEPAEDTEHAEGTTGTTTSTEQNA